MSYLLIESFYIWYACGADRRTGGPADSHVITEICRMDKLQNFLSHGATLARALRARGAPQLRAFLFSPILTEQVELQKIGSGIVVVYTIY